MAPAPTTTPVLPPRAHGAGASNNNSYMGAMAPPSSVHFMGSLAAGGGAALSTTTATAPTPTTAPTSRSHALRGRSFLNHQQRLEIIKKKEEEPRWTQVQLARWAAVHFNLPKEPSQATIAVLLKKREQLKAATVKPQTRTIRAPRHPELEMALLLWVRFLQSKKVPFTGENIRLKASFLATQLGLHTNLHFSTGWMSGFVSRHNLVLARAHKKKPDENAQNDENDDQPLRSILRNASPRDVFALDETSLLYNDLPYDQDHQAHANPERDRICIGLAVNMDSSEKLDPFAVTTCKRKVVGVFRDCFHNVDGNMTARIFGQWIYKLNQRMAATNRKIVLIVDATAPSHFPLHLSHVKLVLLASETHPLNAGITKTFKSLYRKTHLSFAVDQAEDGRTRIFDVSLPRALQWVKQAWQEVPSELIRTCWARAGLSMAMRVGASDQAMAMAVSTEADIHPEVVQSLVVSLSQLQLLETVPMETLLNPRSEEEAHYVYDDATVARIVAGEALSVDDAGDGAANDRDQDMEQERDTFRHDDAATMLAPSFSSSSGGGGGVNCGRGHVLDEESAAAHGFEVEPPTEQLLANYRGVIWSLDAQADHSEEYSTVLRFLRRKQAALRMQQQQQQQQPPSSVQPIPSAMHVTLAPTSIDTHTHVL